jgi:hypothetical protein
MKGEASMMEQITEEQKVHVKWYEGAKNQTVESLPGFINHLVNDYGHDYGTICHALAAGAIAAATAIDKSPTGGITGFQAGAVMWEFIRHWNFSSNKCGLRIFDYDNFLYPQYAYKHQKTITTDTWKAIQEEAARLIADADEKHAEYLINKEQYEKDLAKFVAKFTDYHERREHYDHLGIGTGDQWEAEREKEKSGFEFAPREPYEPITKGAPVYSHWEDIVHGSIPFGYRIHED